MSTDITDQVARTPLPADPVAPPARKFRFRIDKRFLAPMLITCILIVGEAWYGILESYWATGLAIISSILLDMILTRIATGAWPHLASPYITGLSVGILVRSTSLWPYMLCSMLSISSKYALRVKNRHLWNPSNLGVSLLLILIPTAVAPLSQQWGNSRWPPLIILCLGSVILYTLGRLHITATFLAAFCALSYFRSVITDGVFINEIAPITSPSFQLFMIFMITDPKTTTRTRGRQIFVALLVALVETFFRLAREPMVFGGNKFTEQLANHSPYYALFVIAPITNLFEIWWDGRHCKKEAAC